MNFKGSVLLLLVAVASSACATIPAGPSVMVWPGPAKPFEVFQSDDVVCRQWASQQAGADPYADDWALQRRYDNAYMQCMYAKGNQVPGVVRTYRGAVPPPPPPPGYTSPPSSASPPPSAGGYPPPPPPVDSK
jgi:hypothetical protein